MSTLTLEGRIFAPVQNSEGGAVTGQTQFRFSQTDCLITAVYCGGDIRWGHIVGRISGPMEAELFYHCALTGGELKAGKAIAAFTDTGPNGLTISMQWQWLDGTGDDALTGGTSFYKEIL